MENNMSSGDRKPGPTPEQIKAHEEIEAKKERRELEVKTYIDEIVASFLEDSPDATIDDLKREIIYQRELAREAANYLSNKHHTEVGMKPKKLVDFKAGQDTRSPHDWMSIPWNKGH